MNFQEKLDAVVAKNNSLLCIGPDPDFFKLPKALLRDSNPQFLFNKAIIDATHDVVCAYKPNSAFYEAQGARGIEELKMTCDYLKGNYPDIPIIYDAKRGDIGSTNAGYVTYAFDYLGADAITLHPYLGREALAPFLERKEKGCIILCRTSNPGAGEFQDLLVDGKPLYMRVAREVSTQWNANGNCLLVVGATYPKELAQLRHLLPMMTFLVPGIGAQGGDIEKTVIGGKNDKGSGMIISTSRAVIFASNGEDFAQKAREEAVKLKDTINLYRKERK
jgi:orotidine-5'-phosphate decarboxylase